MSEHVVGDDPIAAIEYCYEQGWTDGLPVMPPTRERVGDLLAAVKRNPEEIICGVPERRREVSLRTAAANAAMAGCLPEHFPVVVAALEAMNEKQFNLVGPSASMGGSGILVIVNGPVVKRLDLKRQNNLFGPGNRANATIGRAIRLVLMNAGGAIPGLFDRSTLGHPGKYTYCIAEDEESSPWLPLHAERGCRPEDDAVTVFACEAPRQVRSHSANTPEGVLAAIVENLSVAGTSMSTAGSLGDVSARVRQGEAVVVIAAEHRNTITKGGWSKADIRQHIFERARRTVADLKRVGGISGEIQPGDENDWVSIFGSPDDLMIVAAGGHEGTFSAVLPSWGPRVNSTSVTRAF